MKLSIVFKCLDGSDIISRKKLAKKTVGLDEISLIRNRIKATFHHKYNTELYPIDDIPLSIFSLSGCNNISHKRLTIDVDERWARLHNIFSDKMDMCVWISKNQFDRYTYMDYEMDAETVNVPKFSRWIPLSIQMFLGMFWFKDVVHKVSCVKLKRKYSVNKILNDWVLDGKLETWAK